MFNFYYFYSFSNVQVSFLLIHIFQIHLLSFTIFIFIFIFILSCFITSPMKIIFMLRSISHVFMMFLILVSSLTMNYFLVILACKIRSHLGLLHHLLVLILCIERSSLPRRSGVISMLS